MQKNQVEKQNKKLKLGEERRYTTLENRKR
jgi:hypothetical protein